MRTLRDNEQNRERQRERWLISWVYNDSGDEQAHHCVSSDHVEQYEKDEDDDGSSKLHHDNSKTIRIWITLEKQRSCSRTTLLFLWSWSECFSSKQTNPSLSIRCRALLTFSLTRPFFSRKRAGAPGLSSWPPFHQCFVTAFVCSCQLVTPVAPSCVILTMNPIVHWYEGRWSDDHYIVLGSEIEKSSFSHLIFPTLADHGARDLRWPIEFPSFATEPQRCTTFDLVVDHRQLWHLSIVSSSIVEKTLRARCHSACRYHRQSRWAYRSENSSSGR